MSGTYRIGIDLGGTKCAGALLGPDGREVTRTRVKTPRGDYDGTIRTVVDLITQLRRTTTCLCKAFLAIRARWDISVSRITRSTKIH